MPVTKALHVKNMKILFSVILILLCSTSAYSDSWVAVDGGVVEIQLKSKELENSLWQYLSVNSKRKFEERSSYIYQYQATSKKTIRINAMCHVFSKEGLNEEFVLVFDGGSCYFEVKYNIKTGKFTDLFVNGSS